MSSDIFDAVDGGNLEEVKELVKSNPTLVHARNKTGMTPLHVAANTGNLEIVEFLIDHDANVNAKTKDGDTPRHMARFVGNKAITDYLFQHGGK